MDLLKELNVPLLIEFGGEFDNEWTSLTPDQEEDLVAAVQAEMTADMAFDDVVEIVLAFMEDIPGFELPDEELAKRVAKTALGY